MSSIKQNVLDFIKQVDTLIDFEHTGADSRAFRSFKNLFLKICSRKIVIQLDSLRKGTHSDLHSLFAAWVSSKHGETIETTPLDDFETVVSIDLVSCDMLLGRFQWSLGAWSSSLFLQMIFCQTWRYYRSSYPLVVRVHLTFLEMA